MKQTKKLLGEYSNIQIKKNVFLFKICVGLLLIINCILYIFTLIFKHSITDIINQNKFIISQTLYLKNNETLTNLKTNKYLVNLLNKTKNRKLYFTTIFNDKIEFDSLINTINYQSSKLLSNNNLDDNYIDMLSFIVDSSLGLILLVIIAISGLVISFFKRNTITNIKTLIYFLSLYFSYIW